MIEVPEPPDQAACSTCGPLIWMLSARTRRWVAWLSVDRQTVRLHPCKFAQDYPTWKQVPHGDPPSAEYVKWKNKNRIENEEQG